MKKTTDPNTLIKIYVLYDASVPSTEPREIRYVGATSGSIEKRRIDHVNDAMKLTKLNEFRHWTHKCCWLRSIDCQVSVEEIDRVLFAVWEETEKKWIKFYKDLGHNLTNGTDGGDGSIGLIWTDEQKKKQSLITRARLEFFPHPCQGKKQTEQHIEANRIGKLKYFAKHDGHMKGRLQKEESKEQISRSLSGKSKTKEHGMHVSIALKALYRLHPEKHPKGNQGHRRTEESKKKQSEKKKAWYKLHPLSEKQRKKQSIKMTAWHAAHPDAVRGENSDMWGRRNLSRQGQTNTVHQNKGISKALIISHHNKKMLRLFNPTLIISSSLFRGKMILDLKEIRNKEVTHV